MTPRRGPGRPTLFDDTARQRYLNARQAGATQKDAATAAGVGERTVRDARRNDPAFRTLDNTTARAARLDRLPHGEYRYNHHQCRCPICIKAATAARTGRPDRAREETPIMINPPRPESPSSFPLARAS